MRPALEDVSTMAIAAGVGAISAVVLIGLIPVTLAVQPGAQFAWYAARAAGMLAYVLAAMSVVFGIATSTKLGGRLFGKSNVADVHRALSLLCLLAIGAHTLFLGLDQYSNFTLSELFIPFVTWYRPVWTSLGIIAAYLTFAVYVSFYLRPVIGYKAWRSFHYLAFAVFGIGTVHGMLAGTDTHSSWALRREHAGGPGDARLSHLFAEAFRRPGTSGLGATPGRRSEHWQLSAAAITGEGAPCGRPLCVWGSMLQLSVNA